MAASDERDAARRALPSVDRILDALGDDYPHALAVTAARDAVAAARDAVGAGSAPSFEEIVASARAHLEAGERRSLRPVINATGVLIHTNLGRAPLGAAQLDAVRAIAGGYSNLEYDLDQGRRGNRYAHATRRLAAATGAEAALVVNNNAAAVLLVLSALCAGREVVISRGELIEIGGEFRIPDVLEVSGARLVEVGTTNRTHLADYERAIGPDTAAILKVHPSNYRVVGFTSSVPGRDLARLARGRGVCFIHDLGSGLLDVPSDSGWLTNEPPIEVALDEGADLVTFSGDKLLGGPQAGIVVGRAELIDKLARNPLLRALRVDKMTLAALDATLELYLEGRSNELPLWDMATADLDALETRARSIADALPEGPWKVEAVPTRSVAGGGSTPGEEFSSWGLAATHPERTPEEIERALRSCEPPVIARIDDDRVVLDVRTILPDQDRAVTDALARSLTAL